MSKSKGHIVTIERSAVEVVELRVTAPSQEAAEQLIYDALNTTRRVGPDELAKMKGVKVTTSAFSGDDESSWEIN